jgi:hypothetical protein
MIIDGMDQGHTRIPFLQQVAFGDQITQHLTGVLIHGTGIFSTTKLYFLILMVELFNRAETLQEFPQR